MSAPLPPPSRQPADRPQFTGRPRALGVDFDGTLTRAHRPAPDVLAAIAEARSRMVTVVLVTGRILDELLVVFPDVVDHFDALVVENGAEIDVAGHRIATAPPVCHGLTDALAIGGVPHRRGRLIVAASGADEHRVVDAIARTGLECQLVRNRGELMILPPGINKGVGFTAALAELGISPHDSVAVGDAENDHSLLAVAELGVAVADAVPSLRSAADVVLDEPDGAGIVALLADLTGPAELWRRRSRPRLVLGHDAAGEPVCIPAHPSNVVITAGSGAGKSYLAGLIAEQLVDLGYSVLVVDPEGDHVGLESLRRAVVLGDDGPPPPPDAVVNLLKRSDTCVVLDLSELSPHERRDYLAALPATIEAGRRRHGHPHWIIVDEAHHGFDGEGRPHHTLDPAGSGYCLVTWRPADLPGPIVAATDIVIALTGDAPDPGVVDLTAAVAAEPRAVVAALLTGSPGELVVARRDRPHDLRVARVAGRRTEHFRHEHKYETDGSTAERAFWFRDDQDRATGLVARNLHDLELVLARCETGVIRHHAPLGDFSRWIAGVFHDRRLASAIADIERRVTPTDGAAAVDATRIDLIDVIHRRHHRPGYPGGAGGSAGRHRS